MKRLLLLISSIGWFCVAQAQSDTLAVSPIKSDSVINMPAKPKFVSPSLVFDLGKAAVSAYGQEKRYEGGITFLFLERYYLAGEYGVATLNPKTAFQNGTYTSEGSYYRLGGGYLSPLNASSKLGLGVNYAISNYADQGEILVQSAAEVQEDYSMDFKRENLSARWLELVLTSESNYIFNKEDQSAKANKILSFGFYFRLRFMSSYEKFTPIDVYSIPGYGKIANNPAPALNLYIRVSL